MDPLEATVPDNGHLIGHYPVRVQYVHTDLNAFFKVEQTAHCPQVRSVHPINYFKALL